MTGETDDQRFVSWRSWRPWRALRVGLIGAWCLWAVLAWWTAPRPADVEKVRADIAANDVAVYQWAGSWERPTVSSWGSVPRLRMGSREGPLFVWRTHDGRTYYAVLDSGDASPAEPLFVAGTANFLGPQTESVRAALMASLLDTGRPLHGDVRPASRYLATAIGLVGLAILLGGPAPVIGTRWYWFWIGAGIPLGLGMVAWLILERPWSQRVGRSSEPGVDKRDRGLIGFLITVVAAAVLSALGVLLRSTFGTSLIPELPG